MINVTLPDGSNIEAENGSTLYDIIGKIGAGLQKSALAASVDGELKDLTSTIDNDFELRVHTFKDEIGQEVYWHSTSHLMAQAVRRLYPDAQYTIGPAIDNGFYYDFDLSQNFTPDDLEKIENEMYKIRDEAIEVTHTFLPKQEAIDLFKKKGQNYKIELINEIDTETISIYSQGEFSDLCRGPHVKNTADIKEFKLMKLAGAYWRGDEKNKMLQRVYGISFPDKKQLKKHIQMLEEAAERDHRKLGKDLALFETAQEIGSGLILWTPKGGRIRTIIENFWKREHYKNGYEIIYTPHIGRSHLWETSGHLDFYADGMYSPMDIDGENYYVKPMNCPFHIMLYKSQKRSYRDFPFRWAELGTVYRYEKSGTLHGLLRVRGFTQDDAHLFCRVDQITSEIITTFQFMMFILESFGFEHFQVYLSTKPEDAVGEDSIWEESEKALSQALESLDVNYKVNEGDGAFYGPKIDIAIKDVIGREWQLSTLQLDFNLPERFDLTYTGSDGEEHRPIMIHRALMGSLERFFGILIEHYKGALPVWLSPVQVSLLSINDEVIDDVNRIADELRKNEIRVSTDLRKETVNYKVREAANEKIPFVCVIGKKEVENGTVSVRRRGEQKAETMSLDELISEVNSAD
jgi:threonyl-tRNA synthetase